ncbi:MAG: ParB/RepB/Spo0J family partition protein [Candidatus Moranbacteria bacterium]|nr:ParB/RepB/Spo0J family partition protein [Candidatus Moranbacteria bacterium]
MANNYGLGRGLASLIPRRDEKTEEKKEADINQPAIGNQQPILDPAAILPSGIQEVDIIRITPNPHQPRIKFDPEKLQELAASVKEHGIIQPLVVTKNDGGFEIIAGERRLQAAKIAGLTKVPVIVREASSRQKLELALIENIQRHDLNPVEEAKSYNKLVEDFDLSQEEISQKVGKSRSAIANKIRLLNLPVEIQRALIEEKITEGHAKAILAIENPEKQRALFELILKNHLTVRQVESKTQEISVRAYKRLAHQDPELKAIEDKLVGLLGTKVKLSKSGDGGKIIIEYYSQEELGSILDKLGNNS